MSTYPFLSIVIPAHNEEGCIASTCQALIEEFRSHAVDDYEIIVVNDNSSDRTETILQDMQRQESTVRYVNNPPPHGFGFAVRRGLEAFRGDAVAIVMGDLSDSPKDVMAYYCALKKGAECVFGSRFIKGSAVLDYPRHKLVLNRTANWFIKILFGLNHNDITNAFIKICFHGSIKRFQGLSQGSDIRCATHPFPSLQFNRRTPPESHHAWFFLHDGPR